MNKEGLSFKPCYKWNTFNTFASTSAIDPALSFKPCYKWNTFNTLKEENMKSLGVVF